MSTNTITRLLARVLVFGLSGALVLACSADPDALEEGTGDEGTGAEGEDAEVGSAEPTGRSYAGYGGAKLEADRVQAVPGSDRARVKPYSIMGGEYSRALGTVPASYAGAADTFGTTPERWFEDGEVSAITLSTSFNIAFDGCTKYAAGQTAMAAAPTTASAPEQCTAMMKKFWNQTPQPAEVDACAKYATAGTAQEPDARRKWAYVCASVLTSTRFLTF